jgi:hypothetical protein
MEERYRMESESDSVEGDEEERREERRTCSMIFDQLIGVHGDGPYLVT